VTDPVFITLIVSGAVIGALLISLIGTIVLAVRATRSSRRRRREARAYDEGAPPDALEAFGVDISVWPSRAPRNGSSEETHA
jgi:hypothetical protein